jgi:hypothetical protein
LPELIFSPHAAAMAARFETRLWDIGDIVKLIEEWEGQALK